jgi:hypothetical protein
VGGWEKFQKKKNWVGGGRKIMFQKTIEIKGNCFWERDKEKIMLRIFF